MFSEIALRGKGENNEEDHFDEEKTGFIIEDVQKILLNIQTSTMGTDSEEDFDNLFFTMDVAKKKDKTWIIMELGDGQVAGLPDNANTDVFYNEMKNSLKVKQI